MDGSAPAHKEGKHDVHVLVICMCKYVPALHACIPARLPAYVANCLPTPPYERSTRQHKAMPSGSSKARVRKSNAVTAKATSKKRQECGTPRVRKTSKHESGETLCESVKEPAGEETGALVGKRKAIEERRTAIPETTFEC